MTAQDEEDDSVRVDEYREFSAAQGDEDEQQYKETVILNHGRFHLRAPSNKIEDTSLIISILKLLLTKIKRAWSA